MACIIVVFIPYSVQNYTPDQPRHHGMRNFILYEDDIHVTVQYTSFTQVERTIEYALDEFSRYYNANSLHTNPESTQDTAFHMKNK